MQGAAVPPYEPGAAGQPLSQANMVGLPVTRAAKPSGQKFREFIEICWLLYANTPRII